MWHLESMCNQSNLMDTKKFKVSDKIFLHKKCCLLVSFFVANNRMNLIALNQNHLHANGHLNLPWFFIFVRLFIFVGNQMWLGAIKIESQSCINNFLCQNKSIVDIENGFTQTTLRFIYNLPRSFNSMKNIPWNILNHEQSHRNAVIWTYSYANPWICPTPNNAFFL